MTGTPGFGVKEVPAPASDVPGEKSAPTQPEPLKPPAFSRQQVTDEDVANLSPESHDYALKELGKFRHGRAYEPPSEQGTVEIPGFHGGATWAGASFDPSTGYLYVNSNNVPAMAGVKKNASGGYSFSTAYSRFTDDHGYPGIKPPWGNLTCIDLNTGDFVWQIPLGEYPELTAKGVPRTGTENFGGTIVTAGGLVFIGGARDEKFHAFDKATGKLLWEYQLRAGGYATPCTYELNGKQFVCIAAGGGGKQRTKEGDEFLAFALP
jgi:quinoprotein glucose dehydrogenase